MEAIMNITTTTTLADLGSFEGFNFRDQAAIMRTLTADDVVQWDHDKAGEAEFWPSGDDHLISGVFPGNVTGADLAALAELLEQLDGDRDENLLRIQFACQVQGEDFRTLTAARLDDVRPMIFYGDTFMDARKTAAFELFETFWPDLYKAWEGDSIGVLTFDWDSFIDSPIWATHEVDLGNHRVLMIISN